jgi:uroporphyrin-3 C-methyltransferase
LEAAKTAIAKGDINALALAEVEYLLRMADYKLRFQSNVSSAIEALDQAETRLNQVDELPFATVERMIGENLATLRAVKLPDLSAISQQIGGLAKEVDKLPLKIDAQVANLKGRVVPEAINLEQSDSEAESQAPWWERAIQSAWAQMKDVVIVRHGRSSGPPLIAVEEEYFLRENLKLELEAMRLALLRNDPATYQAANQLTQEWAQTYFDTKAEAVTGFVNQLQELHKLQLNPYVPDISGTLRAFDDVMKRRQPLRASTSAPASPDTPPQAEAADAAKSDSSAVPATTPGEAPK